MVPGASSSVQPCASMDQSLHKFSGGAPSVPALRSSGTPSVRLCLTLRPRQAVEKPPTHPPLPLSLFSHSSVRLVKTHLLSLFVGYYYPPYLKYNYPGKSQSGSLVQDFGLLQTGLLNGSEQPPFIPPAWMWDYGRGEGGWGRRGALLL